MFCLEQSPKSLDLLLIFWLNTVEMMGSDFTRFWAFDIFVKA